MSKRAYAQDLAYIHDVGFGDFAKSSAPGILGILKKGGVPNGTVVDLGSGSGIWAKALSGARYDVVGWDISGDMIAMARKRAPKARFHKGSFLDAKLPACDAVTSLGECFNYLFDGRNGAQQLEKLFRRIHAALRPDGLLVFDVAGPGRRRGLSRTYVEGKDWAILVESEMDERKGQLTRRMTTFRQVGRAYRRGAEVHVQQLYPPQTIETRLRRTGFRVRRVLGYGAKRFPKGLTGFVARKV